MVHHLWYGRRISWLLRTVCQICDDKPARCSLTRPIFTACSKLMPKREMATIDFPVAGRAAHQHSVRSAFALIE